MIRICTDPLFVSFGDFGGPDTSGQQRAMGQSLPLPFAPWGGIRIVSAFIVEGDGFARAGVF